MPTLKLRRLTRPAALKRIGRTLLAQFFASIQRDLQSGSHPGAWPLPPPELPDAEYFRALSDLLMRPESLPGPLNEALCAIDEMASPQGHAVLEADRGWPAKMALLKPDSTREDIALQVWLADPDYLASVHNKLRFRRLTAFEHAAHPGEKSSVSSVQCSDTSAGGASAPQLSNSPTPKLSHSPADPLTRPLPPLDRLAMYNLTIALDEWFLRNGRGSETARVEIYPMEREYWFLIRHGDLFTRTPKVEQQKTHILHFRPERDDVVVYSPALDELRVNARTQGERDLYIRQFGLHLRGREDYFSNRATYTLEPLRTAGVDALDPRQVEGVEKIRLRELETADLNGEREVITRAVQGLFEFAAANPGRPDPIPKEGRLARAIFEIQFTGSAKSFPVEIRLPNVLKVSRNCDAALVQDWLSVSGFRRGGVVVGSALRRRQEVYVTPQLI